LAESRRQGLPVTERGVSFFAEAIVHLAILYPGVHSVRHTCSRIQDRLIVPSKLSPYIQFPKFHHVSSLEEAGNNDEHGAGEESDAIETKEEENGEDEEQNFVDHSSDLVDNPSFPLAQRTLLTTVTDHRHR